MRSVISAPLTKPAESKLQRQSMGGDDLQLSKALKSYVADLSRVPGCMHPVDAHCYAAILTFQRSYVGGSVAEIGVFYGRSFFLLATSLAGGEKAYAADLFSDGAAREGDSAQLKSFKEKASKMGLSIPGTCVVKVGSSSDLTEDDILSSVGPIRFFSVDGGHLLNEVTQDADLAAKVLVDRGVIAFDDFCNPEWPETSLSVFDFLRSRQDEYVPFAITKAKLYVCKQAAQSDYLRALNGSKLLSRFQVRKVQFLGHEIPWIHQPVHDRAVYEAFSRLGLGRVLVR